MIVFIIVHTNPCIERKLKIDIFQLKEILLVYSIKCLFFLFECDLMILL